MPILGRRSWQLPESAATPEHLCFDRRGLLAGGLGVASAMALTGPGRAQRVADLPDPTKDLYPAKRNERFVLDRPVTDETVNGTYNNFYEFSLDKEEVAEKARNFKTRPWTVEVSGEVNKPMTFDIDDLLKRYPLERRIYRFRCVEAWSMVIPWVGFPLAALLKDVDPRGNAKYVEFTTLHDPKRMPNQKRDILKWPYLEGLRMDEAMHPLTLLAVGLYDEVMPPQNGAPIRLVVPWKYGFKNIKSVVRIRLVEQQPQSTWQQAGPSEYGFYANVNPTVDHPRWSQARERRIGDFLKRPTLMFNGYAEEVAGLYAGMDLTKFI